MEGICLVMSAQSVRSFGSGPHRGEVLKKYPTYPPWGTISTPNRASLDFYARDRCNPAHWLDLLHLPSGSLTIACHTDAFFGVPQPASDMPGMARACLSLYFQPHDCISGAQHTTTTCFVSQRVRRPFWLQKFCHCLVTTNLQCWVSGLDLNTLSGLQGRRV